jgi:hypothetical protein
MKIDAGFAIGRYRTEPATRWIKIGQTGVRPMTKIRYNNGILARQLGGIMPDADGKLTPEDHQKIQAWWTTGNHWMGPVICPVCKTTEWSVADHILLLTRHSANGLVSGSIAYPMIGVYCRNCSHTMLFNAVTMGVAGAYNPAADQTVHTLLPAPNEAET